MNININDLTLEQLYQLNDMVCQRIDQIRAQQEREAIARIRPGMKVTIEGPDGTIFGITLKLNRKTIIVASEDKLRQYKVAAGLVKPVNDLN